MATIKDLPGSVQAAIAVVILIATVVLTYASVANAITTETAERRSDVLRLNDADSRQEKHLEKIEQMLREELDRHHPRHQ
jgi:hypothetical protein